MKINSNVKASGLTVNHNQSGLAVKSNVKAGELSHGGRHSNHNQTVR
jgi:hypothetical protein